MKTRYMELGDLQNEIDSLWLEIQQIKDILQTDRHLYLFEILVNLMTTYELFQQDMDNFDFHWYSILNH